MDILFEQSSPIYLKRSCGAPRIRSSPRPPTGSNPSTALFTSFTAEREGFSPYRSSAGFPFFRSKAPQKYGRTFSNPSRKPSSWLPPLRIRKSPPKWAGFSNAEREGFEPSVRFPALRFSRPVQSTTLPPLPNYVCTTIERNTYRGNCFPGRQCDELSNMIESGHDEICAQFRRLAQ